MYQRHNDTDVMLLKTLYIVHPLECSLWNMFLISKHEQFSKQKRVYFHSFHYEKSYIKTFITLLEHFKYLEEFGRN